MYFFSYISSMNANKITN